MVSRISRSASSRIACFDIRRTCPNILGISACL
jgi:hypothetical protein